MRRPFALDIYWQLYLFNRVCLCAGFTPADGGWISVWEITILDRAIANGKRERQHSDNLMDEARG
jgi:hypothetical protein